MQTVLSITIAVWFGIGCGAATDQVIPGFWIVWSSLGIALILLTAIYVRNGRSFT